MRDLAGMWREGEADRRAAMQARQAVMQLARQEPFDEQKMSAALAAMRGADQAVLARYHEALAKSLGKLNAAERVAALRAAAGRPGMMRMGGQGRLGPDGQGPSPGGPDGPEAPAPNPPPAE
jgi:hypothetical protein